MVINQVNIVDIALFKAKDDPPVGGNRNTPKSPQIASQRMEPVSRQVKVRGLASSIEIRQSKGDSFRLISTYPAGVAALIQPLETSMSKRPNRKTTVPCSGTPVSEGSRLRLILIMNRS